MSLFNRRRMFNYFAQKQKEKKPIYLPYLESVGQQWIDTGIYGHQGMTISVTGTFLSTHGFLYGSRKAGRDILLSKDDDNGGWAGVGLNSKYTADLRVGVKNKFVMVDGGFVYVNDVKNVALPKTQEYQSQAPIALFALANDVGVAQRGSAIRIYSFQAYDASGMIINLRPCLNPETFRPAMYDTVSGKYFYNQGSGEFAYDLSFVALDYIHMDGKEYIDTGLTTKDGISADFEAKVKQLTGAYTGILFGGRVSGSDGGFTFYPMKEAQYWTGYGGATVGISEDISPLLDWFHLEMGRGYLRINGLPYKDNTAAEIKFSSTQKIAVGTWMTGAEPDPRQFRGDIKRWSFAQGGILVQDVIPVRDNNGVICFWDFIKGEYLLNASADGSLKGYIGDTQIGSYVTFDGQSYIDTGFHISRDMQAKTYLSNSAKETHASYWIHGARAGNGVGILFNPREYYAMFGGVSQPYADTTIYNAYVNGSPFTITMREGFLACNDTQLKIGGWVSLPSQDLPMTLGTIVDKNGMIDARMYNGDVRTHIFSSPTACAYFVPAKKSDGTVGMLDVVTGQLHENKGTGTLTFAA